MKKLFPCIGLCLVLLFVTACATSGIPAKSSLSDDLGSPEKTALLRERADNFWSALSNEEYEKVYYLYDPFFRSVTDINSYYGTMGKVKYHNFNITDVKVEGNVGFITIDVVYSLPKVKMRIQEFEVPPTEGAFTEKWLYIYDNWYKEFYIHMIEMGTAEY